MISGSVRHRAAAGLGRLPFSKTCTNTREFRDRFGFTLARSAIWQRSHAHRCRCKRACSGFGGSIFGISLERKSLRGLADTSFSMPPHTSWRTVARMLNRMGLHCKEVRCTSCSLTRLTLAGFKQCLEAAAASSSRHLA